MRNRLNVLKGPTSDAMKSKSHLVNFKENSLTF